MNLYQQVERNKRDTWIFLSVFVLFFLFLGLGADYFYGTGLQAPFYSLLAFGLAAGGSLAGYLTGDKFILASTRARPLDPADPKQNQWQNVVEEMSIAAGIPVPKTYFIDDADPNAFATGRDPRHASIAVTRGLLEALTREELQGVAAHEMSHIKNFDVRLMLIVSVLAGAAALVADWSRRMAFRRSSNSGRQRQSQAGGPVMLAVLSVWIVFAVLAPLISRLVAMCVSRGREYLADATGAELTRNPQGLASALQKINSFASPTHTVGKGVAHLCIADPSGSALNESEGWFAELFSTHPPLTKRIGALQQMAYLKVTK